ncbi:MAG TPA: SPOR domain-containing protein [Steroidobacteraceae bacterium]|nr:SPOR domain-containing protein [Steroidobacteraceae bacterium]
MITFRAGTAALFAALLAVTACSAEQQDWRSAEAAGTSEAYQHFLEQHPDSELAAKARERVADFLEERDWTEATRVGTADAYRGFLAAHSGGRWAQEARIRIESFALGSIPRMAPQAPGQTAAPATGVNILRLASAASSGAGAAAAPAAAAPPAVVSSMAVTPSVSLPASAGAAVQGARGYAVQLGAFGTEASADREWQRLQTRFGTQLSGLAPQVVSAGTASGQLYRLQASAAGEAQARAICDSLKAQSQACVPVVPR